MPEANELVKSILEMKTKGIADNDIIAELQRQGYKSSQIFDALSTALRKPGIAPEAAAPAEPIAPAVTPGPALPIVAPAPGVSTEELVEAIIDEKWTDITANINRVIEWKDDIEAKITKIEADISNIKESFKTLQGSVLGKVGEYEKAIIEVTTEIKALESVFKKILPGFIENVHELSRITEKLKKKPSK